MNRQSWAILIIFLTFIYLTKCDGKEGSLISNPSLTISSLIQYLLSQQESFLQSIPTTPLDNDQDFLEGGIDSGYIDGAAVMEERESAMTDMERELRRELNGTPQEERIWPRESERNNPTSRFDIEYDDEVPEEEDEESSLDHPPRNRSRRRVDPLGNRIPKPFNYGERNPYRLDDTQIYDPNNPYPIPNYPEDLNVDQEEFSLE